MNKPEIVETIMRSINRIADIEMAEMTPDSAVMADLELSSFETLAMISELERAYHVRFTNKALRTLITIDDLAEYILQNDQA